MGNDPPCSLSSSANFRNARNTFHVHYRKVCCPSCPLALVLTVIRYDSPIHPNLKAKLIASDERDTIHILRTMRNSARVFKNAVAKEVVAIEHKPGGAKFKDVEHLVAGVRGKLAYENGDPDYGIWSASVSVGLINDCPTCAELVHRIEHEAEATIDMLSGLKAKIRPRL